MSRMTPRSKRVMTSGSFGLRRSSLLQPLRRSHQIQTDEAGRLLSGCYSPKAITPRASFTVMPSLRLIVNSELSPDELNMLELFADRIEEAEWLFSMVRTLKVVRVV